MRPKMYLQASTSGSRLVSPSKEVLDVIASVSFAAPGYEFDTVPDLSRLSERERLSQSAIDGFFAITERWNLTVDQQSELLGGVSRSSIYNLKTAAGTRTQDELTRISYLTGIYKALHILLPEEIADLWITRDNDNPLFAGRSPLSYAVRRGIPGLEEIRRFLDAARGGL